MRLKLGMALLAVGCAVHSAPEPDASTDVVRTTVAPGETLDLSLQTLFHDLMLAAPRVRVWDALLAAEEDLDMRIESVDSAGGIVVFYVQTPTPRIAGRHASTWLDCGTGPGGVPRVNTYVLTARLTVLVESVYTYQTRARAALVAYARDRSVIGDRLPCTSNGKLEQRALAILGARLTP